MKHLIFLFIGVVMSVNVYGQESQAKIALIKKLFSDANIALNDGDTLAAINKFKEVFIVNSNDTNACGRLGKIYGNTKSSFFNKKFALKYYNLFLQYSKNEKNKEKVRAEIQRLSQYEDSQNVSGLSGENDVLDDSRQNKTLTTNTGANENTDTDYNEIAKQNSKNNKNNDDIQTEHNIETEEDINDYNIIHERLIVKRKNQKENHNIDNNNDYNIILPPDINIDVIEPVDPITDRGIFKDTILNYLQPFDILKEDVKALKEADCPKKDGTQYVSALFNHKTGRDAFVLVFDDKEKVSLHKDCDLMVGFREIVKKEKIDFNNQIKVTSNIMPDKWVFQIELNLPDSILNDPLWSKNVYRMVGSYFNQSVKIDPVLIGKTNQVSQKGKTLKISYRFELEPINGILFGKSTICAEKTDGCKCVLAFSETNQLFGLANDEYRIKDANIEKIQKLNVDAESAQSAYEQYQEFCAFHQRTKNDKKNYTEYVNRINGLTAVNQPEALFTSYLVRLYGFWNINKKLPSTKRWANQCKEKIISLQRFLKKNNW